GRIELGLVRPRVDGEQRVPRVQIRAVGEVDPGDPSRNLRLDRDHLARDDLADLVEIDRHVARDRRRHGHRRRRPLERRRGGFLAAGESKNPEKKSATPGDGSHLAFLPYLNRFRLIFWRRASTHRANRRHAGKLRSRSALTSTGVSSRPEAISSLMTASLSASNRRRNS